MENKNLYEELGFMSGVEIHQQLLTKSKLFCHCPAGKYTTKCDAKLLRHMRPTLSELGEYDGTALMEFKTKKEIIYLLNKENVCTYEMDDTPPFLVNQDALDIAIEIALLLNCQIIDEMHIARKQYLDGSIPTGFQRTAIVGLEGYVPFNDKKIGIIQLGFEEDSCREVSDVGHRITYNTDRLGIPLIEVVTYPDMKTPNEVAEVIRTLGRILRITEKVRRGIGSVRQDVNVSIRGGTRIEIKGVPQISWVPSLTHTEALRQKALLDIRDILKAKHITRNEDLITLDKDLTSALKSTKLEVLRNALKQGHSIRGIKLSGIKEILNFQTQPGLNFTTELMGRVRVIACLDQLPILYTTENWPFYENRVQDLKKIKNEFQMGDNDAVVICWGPHDDTITATKEIRLRLEDAIKGVPSETRQANLDGTTDFERILPGADRMYPDTDHPPTRILSERVERIKAGLPSFSWEREKKYVSYGIPRDSARELAISKYAKLFDRIEKQIKIDMKLVGIVLTQKMKALRRKGVAVNDINDDKIIEIFEAFSKSMYAKEYFPNLLQQIAIDTEKTVESIILENHIKPVSEKEIIDAIAKALEISWKKNRQKIDKSFKVSFYMGKVMKNFIGKVDGAKVLKLLEPKIK